MKKRTWIKMTIAEPFPVFFAHVAYPEEGRRETAKGPHYAAGSESWHLPEHAAHVQFSAAHLRERGWTVTVEPVLR